MDSVILNGFDKDDQEGLEAIALIGPGHGLQDPPLGAQVAGALVREAARGPRLGSEGLVVR